MKFDYKIGEVYIDTDNWRWAVVFVGFDGTAELERVVPHSTLPNYVQVYDTGTQVDGTVQLFRKLTTISCECGSKACRGLTHSDWCPMHESGGKEPYKLPNQLLF